jgi:hypothetical protein
MPRPVASLGLLPLVLFATTPAASAAGIVCRESYQLVRGTQIATPYCADNYLARVAREYGVRVSNAEIRNNPNRKSEVCRLIGHDIRVSDNCPDESVRGRRGF